jgi:hypothetical protein
MSLCDDSPPDGAKFTDRAGAERPRDIEEPKGESSGSSLSLVKATHKTGGLALPQAR